MLKVLTFYVKYYVYFINIYIFFSDNSTLTCIDECMPLILSKHNI